MDNTPTEEERLDQQAREAREQMLAGEDTPYMEREPHRGEQAHVEGGGYVDPAQGGPGGASGGVNFGSSGSHQGHATPRGQGGSSSGGSHRNHGDDAPGAFGEETGGTENIRYGDNTRDKAVEKLQDL